MRTRVVVGGLLTLLAGGCYASHVRGAGDDPDASSARDAGWARDAGDLADVPVVRPDAPLPPSCAPRALDVACTDTGTMMVPVGRPHDLPVHFGDGRGCFAGRRWRAARASKRASCASRRRCARSSSATAASPT